MARNFVCLSASLAVVFICSIAAAGTTITLQNGTPPRPGQPLYWDTEDAWLNDEASSRNYGGSTILEIDWDSGYNDNVVIKFDLSGHIPLDQRILSAKLSLWYIDDTGMTKDEAATIKPFRIEPGYAWDENIYVGESGHGVNYNYVDDGQTQGWTDRAGGWWNKIDDGNGTNRIAETDTRVTGEPPPIEPQDWVDFVVTNSVAHWYGGQENNGFLLTTVGYVGGSRGGGEFGARDDSASNYRPKLQIIYEGALLPVSDPDGPYVCDVGQMINIDGTASYDPDGGLITAYEWDLNDDGAWDYFTDEFDVSYQDLLNLGMVQGVEYTVTLRVTDDENDTGLGYTTLTLIPEPAALSLLALGAAALMRCSKRRLCMKD